MATAVINGIRMHYRRIGEGSPIVLLHGWPQTGYAWRHVADDLAADHTVIVPDLRGYGRSDKPAGGMDTRTMAADLSALLRELGFHPDDRHPGPSLGPTSPIGRGAGEVGNSRYDRDRPVDGIDVAGACALHTVAELLTERPSFSVERSMAGQIAEVLHPAAIELDGGRPVPLVRRAVDELAALRRVATLVAGGAQPGEVFTAVADELARLIGAEATFVSSVDLSSADGPGSPAADPSGECEELEGYGTVLGSYGRVTGEVPVGFRMKLPPGSVITAALRTGRPARANGEALAKGPFGAIVGRLGIRAAVATPIVVEGRHWGVTVAGTSREDFPAGTESRMADFMELAAMAIANARAEQELRELADTQAALRRLAMLVARGEPAETVFAAATREALRHFGGGTARMVRYEPDGTATLLANEGTTGPHVRVGEPWTAYPPTGLTATVWRTGQAARVEDYRDIPGGEPYLREGLRSAAAVPIHVNGRLWGVIAVGSGQGPLPADTEHRMTLFTDLVATAVANAQNRAELIASRARIVAASDEAHQRIERNLHDGAQQHLIALALRLRVAVAAHESDEVRREVTDVAADLTGVIEELREISHGIHPVILSRAGLRPALRALGRRSAVPVKIDVRIDGRLPEPIEVGAYYAVSEMLTNTAKHAHASAVEVDAEVVDRTLRVCVRDDGVGGADPRRGSGLVGLNDRIEALGGTFSLHSPTGGGTTVSFVLPVPTDGGQPDANLRRRNPWQPL